MNGSIRFHIAATTTFILLQLGISVWTQLYFDVCNQYISKEPTTFSKILELAVQAPFYWAFGLIVCLVLLPDIAKAGIEFLQAHLTWGMGIKVGFGILAYVALITLTLIKQSKAQLYLCGVIILVPFNVATTFMFCASLSV